jgi:MFS family permease
MCSFCCSRWSAIFEAKYIGAVVVTVAKNVQYLLGGRFTLGFGVAIATTAAPAYVVEMSPPQWRGRLTGL